MRQIAGRNNVESASGLAVCAAEVLAADRLSVAVAELAYRV